jgi:hypothetical protein
VQYLKGGEDFHGPGGHFSGARQGNAEIFGEYHLHQFRFQLTAVKALVGWFKLISVRKRPPGAKGIVGPHNAGVTAKAQ